MVFEHGEIGEVRFIRENMVVGVIIIVSGDDIQAKRWKGDKVGVKLCGRSVSYIWLMFKLEYKSATTFEHKHTVWYVPFALSFGELLVRERTLRNWRHTRRASRLALGNAD